MKWFETKRFKELERRCAQESPGWAAGKIWKLEKDLKELQDKFEYALHLEKVFKEAEQDDVLAELGVK